MANFCGSFYNALKTLAPSSSAAAYVLAGNVGRISVVGTFLVDIVNIIMRVFVNNSESSSKCSFESFMNLDTTCMTEFYNSVFNNLPYHEWLIIFNIMFRLLTCIVFFIMEDVFNKYETAKVNREFLTLGTALGAVERAFTMGVSSSAVWSVHLDKVKGDIYPVVSIDFAKNLANASSSWIFIFRYLIMSFGIFSYSIFDRKDNYVGKHFSLIGYILTLLGILQFISGILKLCSFGVFSMITGILELIFNILFLVWVFIFSTVCRNKTDHLTESLTQDASVDITN
ncbi:hypothetical protein WA158_005514 [Blastocystis sp. Blastoise]